VVSGEIASGYLFSGQELRATTTVEAGHVYEVGAQLIVTTAGSIGTDEIVGAVSGDPIADSGEIVVLVTSSNGSEPPQPSAAFIAYGSGEVVVEFAYTFADAPESTLDSIRAFIQGPARATYQLLITDLGFDDNGTSPDDAVALPVGLDGELTGTITPADEADFFLVELQADTTYLLTIESTDNVNVTSGAEDRFGQVNFGVPTAAGLVIEVSSSAGVPGTGEFAAPATEEVLMRLSAVGSAASSTIQYAISVVEILPESG
jgi:hypothetical protein